MILNRVFGIKKKMYFVLVVGKLAISSVPTTELRNLQTMEHLV